MFRRVVYRAKGRRAARVCCDAATWTGESCFYSARIGRTPRGSEPSTATVVMETSGSDSNGEEGASAASPRARHSQASLPVPAGDTRGAQLAQEPEAKPHPEVMKHQELPGEAQGSQIPQESSEAEAVLHFPGSSLSPRLRCGDQRVTPLTQTTVEVDVHVSAGDHGDLGHGQDAAESELLRGAEQEAGAGRGAGDSCVGKALWEVPLQKESDPTAAQCPLEEPEMPPKAAEPGEGITDGQRDEHDGKREETEGPPDLQLEQGETAAPEGVKGTAGEAEQDEEMTEACGDGQTPEEIPACLAATQEEEEEKTTGSSEEKPEEH